ncbi:MAG: hypothetical protein Q9184_001438 [Pyrenodesmia sp. 2 TL-2023]
MLQCSPCTTIMSMINIELAHNFPQTWTRLHHWLHLLSDQNIDLYTPQDLLLSTIPTYLEFFLLILSVSYHLPRFWPQDPLDGVTDTLLIPVFVFTAAQWLLTALQYVWLQPGIGNKMLAVIDLWTEQLLVFALTWGALQLANLAAYPAFGWDRVRPVLWAFIGYHIAHEHD